MSIENENFYEKENKMDPAQQMVQWIKKTEQQRDLYAEIYNQQREFIDVLIRTFNAFHNPAMIIDDGRLKRAKPGEIIEVGKRKKK